MSIIHTWGGAQARVADVTSATAQRAVTFDVVDLLAVPQAAWADLAARAVEPNAFYHPAWASAVARHAEGKSGACALLAWNGPARTKLIGFLPVISAWRALRLPIPVLVAWQAYAPLTTPLLDRDETEAAARALMAAAADAGAFALLLPALAGTGPAAGALRAAIAEFKSKTCSFNAHERACLDATQDGDAAVQTLGAKKVKELRRQRNRLADSGDVKFEVTNSGADASAALDEFLKLEAAGWKGARGTALAAREGDAAFVREAVLALVEAGAAEVATLASGDNVVAAGVMLRHQRRGFFFKIAYDETAAKTSPGVQLTLDLTRHMCADAGIDDVDSTAASGHPMIDHVWHSRLAVCDLLLPTRAGSFPYALCAAAIVTRNALRAAAKKLYHHLRMLKGPKP
jgi:CelD/BcsL family acetyltransferase involved in cellulose biosynthesis